MPSAGRAPLRTTPWTPAGGAVALAGLGAFVVGDRLERRAHLETGYVVVLTALLLAAVGLTLRRRPRPDERVALTLAFVPAALPLWLATVWAESRSFTVDRTLENLTLSFGFVCLAPALLSLAVVAGRFAGAALAGRASDAVAAAVRSAAWLVTVGSLAVVAVWAARSRLPTAKRYLASMPVAASFEEVGRSRHATPVAESQGAFTRHELQPGLCALTGVHDPPPAAARVPRDAWGLRLCGAFVVRADVERPLLVLGAPHGPPVAFERVNGLWLPARLSPSRLAGSIRPAGGLAALGLLGVVVALAALLGRRRGDPAGDGACHDAAAFADGTLLLADGTSLSLPDAYRGVVGPVIAVLGARAESFRDHAGPVVLRVLPGTLAQHRFAARVGSAAFALAFVTVAITPLASALLRLW